MHGDIYVRPPLRRLGDVLMAGVSAATGDHALDNTVAAENAEAVGKLVVMGLQGSDR